MKTAAGQGWLRASALVQLLAGFAAQLPGFADPVEREQRAFQPSQFPQRGGHSGSAAGRRQAGA